MNRFEQINIFEYLKSIPLAKVKPRTVLRGISENKKRKGNKFVVNKIKDVSLKCSTEPIWYYYISNLDGTDQGCMLVKDIDSQIKEGLIEVLGSIKLH